MAKLGFSGGFARSLWVEWGWNWVKFGCCSVGIGVFKASFSFWDSLQQALKHVYSQPWQMTGWRSGLGARSSCSLSLYFFWVGGEGMVTNNRNQQGLMQAHSQPGQIRGSEVRPWSNHDKFLAQVMQTLAVHHNDTNFVWGSPILPLLVFFIVTELKSVWVLTGGGWMGMKLDKVGM